MTTRLIKVQHYRRPIGRSCLRCGRPATTTAIRILANKMRLPVHYCQIHYDQQIEGGPLNA